MKRKKLLSLLLAVIMVLSAIPVSAISISAANSFLAPTGFEGSGTESDPYIVNTSSDLYGFIHSDLDLCIKLGQNISVTSQIYVESDITIDMNGKELSIKTSSNGIYVSKYGNLTITGSGKIKYEGNSSLLSVYGTFESKGPVVFECKEVSMGVVAMHDYSKVYIYDGVFKGDRFFNHDQGKLYIYGGEFEKNVHTDQYAITYIYGGTFSGTLTNWGSTVVYDGEFTDTVSTYNYNNNDFLLLVNGYFKKGVTIGENANYKFADNALSYSHKTRTATNKLLTNEEITIFSPYFETQNPAVPYGKTEFDAGTIYEEIEDYTYGFKAKDVPKVFADMDFTLEEKIVVKNSKDEVVYTQTETGKYAKGVEVKLNTLSADDYVIENTINLYYDGKVCETASNTVKITVAPLTNSDYGFKTITPSLTKEELANLYTELDDICIGESLKFGFTSQISQELADKGYNVKEKVYVNYDNKGTLITRSTGKEFDIKNFADKLGNYEVWCTVQLYIGNEYVTGRTHIFKVTVTDLQKVSDLKAKVTAPVAGALPDASVTPLGEGYKTTDVDWSYYDEQDDAYYLMPEGMTFEAGKTYECAVQFEAMDGYTFPENKGYIAGYINGYRGVISPVYSETRAYVTVKFTLPELNPFTVIFTEDSKAQAGSKLTVDLEAMAELDEEFMEAYFNDEISFKWYFDGQLFKNFTDTFEIKSGMAGHYVGVRVNYGDKFVSSEEFMIAEYTEPSEPATGDETPTDPTETTESTETTVTDPAETTESTETTVTDPTETTESTETTATEPTKTTNTTETAPGTDSSEPTEDKGILGDVDGNGKVNIKDATMIQKAVAKIISLTDTEQIRADVNADAKVNIKDATAIQKYVAKIETGLPIGEKIV